MINGSDYCIGFSTLKTNVEGGHAFNVHTMRAHVACIGRTVEICDIAPELAQDKYTSVQFSSWSPDGKYMMIGQFFKDGEHAVKEEKAKAFIFDEGGFLYDSWLVNTQTGEKQNLTETESVSSYNTSLAFWPGDLGKMSFSAIIGNNSIPYIMDADGKNKKPMLESDSGFTYGSVPSPDGKTLVFQTDYKIFLSNGERDTVYIDTGYQFNFSPVWSPDSRHIAFVAGKTNRTADNLMLLTRDGRGLTRLADRGGYNGVMEYLDVYDHHMGSSDVPVWSSDGRYIYFTRKTDDAYNIWRIDTAGNAIKITDTGAGVRNYHPTPSQDGKYIAFGSNRTGTRQLYICAPDGSDVRRITDVPDFHAAMWPRWRPKNEK